MRLITAILIFAFSGLILNTGYSQVSNVSGVVSVFNSEFENGEKKFLSNVFIEETFGRSNPCVSDANGNFELYLVKVRDKDAISLNVRKNGFEIVNHDGLEAIAGQNKKINIFLSPIGKIVENKRKYYNIGKTKAETEFERKLKIANNKLNKLKSEDSQNYKKIIEQQKLISSLYEAQKLMEERARKLAEEFAVVNLDEANKRMRDAFALFQEGLLDSALTVIELNFLEKDINKFRNDIKRGEKIIHRGNKIVENAKIGLGQVIEECLLGARLAITKLNFQLAEKYYLTAISLDTLNTQNMAVYQM